MNITEIAQYRALMDANGWQGDEAANALRTQAYERAAENPLNCGQDPARRSLLAFEKRHLLRLLLEVPTPYSPGLTVDRWAHQRLLVLPQTGRFVLTHLYHREKPAFTFFYKYHDERGLDGMDPVLDDVISADPAGEFTAENTIHAVQVETVRAICLDAGLKPLPF